MLPRDDAVKELYTELAKEGFDPDDVLSNRNDSMQHGGLEKNEVWETLARKIHTHEKWDSIEFAIHPTRGQTGRYYQVLFHTVDWSDDADDWVGSYTDELHALTEERFGDGTHFTSFPEVTNSELNDYIQSEDGFPYQLTVTDIELAEAPEFVRILMTKTNRHISIRIRPDDTFDSYTISWQYLEWDLENEQFTTP